MQTKMSANLLLCFVVLFSSIHVFIVDVVVFFVFLLVSGEQRALSLDIWPVPNIGTVKGYFCV